MILNAESRSQESIDEWDEPVERPVPARFALGAVAVASLALSVAAFLVLCYLPLEPAGLMAHLSYGDWILEHRAPPSGDPVLPLAAGMPLVDASWGSEALLAAVERAGNAARPGAGFAWLATLFALLRLATASLLFAAFRRSVGGRATHWGALGLAFVLALGRGTAGPWAVFSPGTFGLLCLALLLAAWVRIEGDRIEADEAGEDRRALRALGIAGWVALFAIWANLHVSFAIGVLAVGLVALGRLIEAIVRARRESAGIWRTVVADRPFRRGFLLAELAAAATLLSPHGVELWLYVWRLPSSANLRDLPAWRALSVESGGGWPLLLLLGLLLVAFRRGGNRQPLPAAHVLWLGGFGAAVLAGSGLLAISSPLLVFAALPHLAALGRDLASRARFGGGALGRLRAGLSDRFGFLAHRSWHGAVLALALLWAAFALSPVGASLLRGDVRPPEATISASAPLPLTAYLRAHPPQGLTFVPTAWADWLVREGPQGANRLQAFAGTRIEALPGLVWQDYLRVAGGAADWQRVLGRYGVRTAIFDRAAHHGQIQSLRYDDEWRIAYEDVSSMMFERISPAALGAKS